MSHAPPPVLLSSYLSSSPYPCPAGRYQDCMQHMRGLDGADVLTLSVWQLCSAVGLAGGRLHKLIAQFPGQGRVQADFLHLLTVPGLQGAGRWNRWCGEYQSGPFPCPSLPPS